MLGWKRLSIMLAVMGIGSCGVGQGTQGTVSSKIDESLYSTELALRCRLQAIPANCPGEQWIRFILINSSNQALHILKRETPLLPPSSDHFLIMKDGVRVDYRGFRVSFLPPQDEDWIAIEPGRMLSAEFDLSQAYDLDQPGNYTIRYLANLGNLVKEGDELLAGDERILGIASNVLALEKGDMSVVRSALAAGRSCQTDQDCYIELLCKEGKCQPGCKDSFNCLYGSLCQEGQCVPGCNADHGCPPGKICQQDKCVEGCTPDSDCGPRKICNQGKCVAGCKTDDGCGWGGTCVGGKCQPPPQCDSSKVSKMKGVQSAAASMASAAERKLKGIPAISRSNLACFKTWFGAYDKCRYAYVQSAYGKIAAKLGKSLTYRCTSCNAIATVDPETNDVLLCDGYWTALDQKGILLHEIAHTVIQNDQPETYEASEVKALAAANPTGAIHNADNYRLFDYGSCKVAEADCSADATTTGCDDLFKNSCLRDLTPSSCSMNKACGECTVKTSGTTIEVSWKSGFSEKIACTPFTGATCDITLAEQGKECARIGVKSDVAKVEFMVAGEVYTLKEIDGTTTEVTCPDGKKERYKKTDLDRCKINSLNKKPQNCKAG